MERYNLAKVEDFLQASYVEQAQLASKYQKYLEYGPINPINQKHFDKLKLMIALPLFGFPETCNFQTYTDEQEALENMHTNLYNNFSPEQQSKIKCIIQACLNHSTSSADKMQVSKVLINTISANGQLDVIVLRIRLENEDEKRVIGFADADGRFYKNWNDFLLNNTLPKCFMVYPKDGKYICSEKGEWNIYGTISSACSLRNSLLENIDSACHLSCLALTGLSIGAFVLGTNLPRVVAIGTGLGSIVVGTYSVLRSAGALVDKKLHSEKLDLKKKENRQLWVNTAVGVVGIASLGISATIGLEVKCAAALGHLQSLSTPKCILHNLAVYSSHLVFCTSLSNLVYTLFQEERLPNLKETAHFSISLLFYYHTLTNLKTTGQLINKINSHHDYPIRVGPTEGSRIAIEVQDKVLSLLCDKVSEHEHRLKQLEKRRGTIESVKAPTIPVKAVKQENFLIQEFEQLDQFIKKVFGFDNTPAPAKAPLEQNIEASRKYFLNPATKHDYVKADYDPSSDIVADFFEYEFGSEKKN